MSKVTATRSSVTQVVASNGFFATFAAPATALTGASVVGATSLAVTAGSGTNFPVGQMILVDAGTSAELLQVTAVAANTLTITAAANGHAIGAAVTAVTFTTQGVAALWPAVKRGSSAVAGLQATFAAPATALTGASVVGATSLAVTAGSGTNFPVGQLVLVDGGTSAEILKVTAVAANSLTVADGGSGANKAHASGAAVTAVTFTAPGIAALWPDIAG